MTRTATRTFSAALAGAALALAVGAAVPANASDDFGQHVRTCAQTMGFNGQMNPGMHRGYSGWDPSHIC